MFAFPQQQQAVVTTTQLYPTPAEENPSVASSSGAISPIETVGANGHDISVQNVMADGGEGPHDDTYFTQSMIDNNSNSGGPELCMVKNTAPVNASTDAGLFAKKAGVQKQPISVYGKPKKAKTALHSLTFDNRTDQKQQVRADTTATSRPHSKDTKGASG